MYEIYGMKTCTYCQAAQDLLNKKKIQFTYAELNTDFKFSEFMQLVNEYAPDHKTYPLIFEIVDGKKVYIGGFRELDVKLK